MRSKSESQSGTDEVDLVALAQGVWRQRVSGLMAALPVTALGIVYAIWSTPVFEAKLNVQPPAQADLIQLNSGRGGESGLQILTAMDLFDIYVRTLQSQTVRSRFFRTVYLPSLSDEERQSSRDGLYSQFASILKVVGAAKNSPGHYVITASAPDPQAAADWAARYAEMALDLAKSEVLKGIESELTVKADYLEQQIRGERSIARKQREDEIIRLTEALQTAKAINLNYLPSVSEDLPNRVSSGMNGSLSYMRGSEALEAEIANLQSRTSDDPFIEGLRAKQEHLVFYRSLRVAPPEFSMYQQDGMVDRPDQPTKPLRGVIALLSALSGLSFGVVVASARDAWLRRTRASVENDRYSFSEGISARKLSIRLNRSETY